jgi:hypothetical protein
MSLNRSHHVNEALPRKVLREFPSNRSRLRLLPLKKMAPRKRVASLLNVTAYTFIADDQKVRSLDSLGLNIKSGRGALNIRLAIIHAPVSVISGLLCTSIIINRHLIIGENGFVRCLKKKGDFNF